jgi:hypothetical protein
VSDDYQQFARNTIQRFLAGHRHAILSGYALQFPRKQLTGMAVSSFYSCKGSIHV